MHSDDSLSPALRRAFVETTYMAGPIHVRIGQICPELDAVLEEKRTRCATFITADNPGAALQSSVLNVEARAALLAAIEAHEGEGLDVLESRHVPDAADGQDYVEQGWLVFGLQPADAVAIAQRFGQLAVVCIYQHRPAALVPVPGGELQPWRAEVDRSDLSHWAWGRAGRADARVDAPELATVVAGLLGAPQTSLSGHAPVALDAADIPSSRLTSVGVPSSVTTDAQVRARHTWGRSWPDQYRASQGDFSGAPDAVALPRTTDELRDTLQWAASVDADIVPFGGGTNVVHAFQPDDLRNDRRPRVVISMRRIRGLLDYDERDLRATLAAGTTGPEVNRALAPLGVQLRHYPQSWEFSTVGGWVATRAGGHFATRYTHIDDLLVSASAMAPTGDMTTLATPCSGAGPEPLRSLTGSEGALGLITEATLRVHRRPRFKAGFNAFFDTYEDAMLACREILQSGLTPASCRILDPTEAMLNQVDGSGRAIFLLGFESDCDVALEATATACRQLLSARAQEFVNIDTATRGDADGAWRSAFLEAPYLQPALACQGVTVDTLETSGSWSQLPELRRALMRRIRHAAAEQGSGALVSSRMTHAYHDGASLYLTWLTLTDPGRPLQQWSAIKEAANRTIVEAGGAISHHHSVGTVHLAGWRAQTPAPWVDGWMAMRRSLDPDQRLVPWLLSPESV